jgi:glycosyltransferase involved in cell wall biosynthesis
MGETTTHAPARGLLGALETGGSLMTRVRDDCLAMLGGFMKTPASAPHGTQQASQATCNALVRLGRFRRIDVYHEHADMVRGASDPRRIALPNCSALRLCDRSTLPLQSGTYAALYAANGEQLTYLPHVLRPTADWVPVICDIGTSHSTAQWLHFFVAAMTGALRETDGFVFKCAAAEKIFRDVFAGWRARWGSLPFPRSVVIPNGVDPEEHKRDPSLRESTRRELGVAPDDVVFLWFSRLSPGTKGDIRALIGLWRQVLARYPTATLVLAGAVVDRKFVTELQALTRITETANRVVILPNPFEVLRHARTALMSAADVLVHLSTGVEETAPLVVYEGMAHELPVIGAHWSGIDVVDGETGYSVPTVCAPVPAHMTRAQLGRAPAAHNVDLALTAACAPEAVVRACLLMIEQPARRREMAQRARHFVLTERHIDRVAARRVAFIETTSRNAESRGHLADFVPLVDLDAALQTLAARPLGDDDRVGLVDATPLYVLPEARDRSARATLETLVGVLAESGDLGVGELADRTCSALSESPGPSASPARLEVVKRLIVRLNSVGSVTVTEADGLVAEERAQAMGA